MVLLNSKVSKRFGSVLFAQTCRLENLGSLRYSLNFGRHCVQQCHMTFQDVFFTPILT